MWAEETLQAPSAFQLSGRATLHMFQQFLEEMPQGCHKMEGPEGRDVMLGASHGDEVDSALHEMKLQFGLRALWTVSNSFDHRGAGVLGAESQLRPRAGAADAGRSCHAAERRASDPCQAPSVGRSRGDGHPHAWGAGQVAHRMTLEGLSHKRRTGEQAFAACTIAKRRVSKRLAQVPEPQPFLPPEQLFQPLGPDMFDMS